VVGGGVIFCQGREQTNKKGNPVKEAPRKNVNCLLLFCILMLHVEMSKIYHLIFILFTVLSLYSYISIT
jgi:hypothetical protein